MSDESTAEAMVASSIKELSAEAQAAEEALNELPVEDVAEMVCNAFQRIEPEGKIRALTSFMLLCTAVEAPQAIANAVSQV